jgi:hypothetical protein
MLATLAQKSFFNVDLKNLHKLKKWKKKFGGGWATVVRR